MNVIATIDARYTALCRLYVFFLNKWKWGEIKINDEVNYKIHKSSKVDKKFSTTAI